MKEVLEEIINVNKSIERLRCDMGIKMHDIEDRVVDLENDVKPIVQKYTRGRAVWSMLAYIVSGVITLGTIVTLSVRIF